MIRILVVDDSAVLRQSTKLILETDPKLKVVGEASNGAEAIAMTSRLQPDVITMDIRMPRVDGLEAIREIMAEHPTPIVVVTAVNLDLESELSEQASRFGAVSILERPEGIAGESYKEFAPRLIEQVKLMSEVRVVRRTRSHGLHGTNQPNQESKSADGTLHSASSHAPTLKTEIVAIGSSTGGPAALHTILSAMPANFPLPILIVQHISFGFVGGLASWLNEASPLQVKVGEQGERLRPGVVYVGPDDFHLQVDRFNKVSLSNAPPVGGHRPAVTALFQSVAQVYRGAALAVILTGMGADGVPGMRALRDAGAITLAQDEASSVVFGMPKEAIAIGAIQHIVPLSQVARTIQLLLVK